MSLKGIKHPSGKETKEFLYTVADLQKGKKGASNRLYKFVEIGMITIDEHNELIEKYKAEQKTKEKPPLYIGDIPLNQRTFETAFLIISIIVSIYICGDAIAIVKDSYWLCLAVSWLLFCAFIYHHNKVDIIESKDREIAELKHKIYLLNEGEKASKHIIELLEIELEKARNNSQQE